MTRIERRQTNLGKMEMFDMNVVPLLESFLKKAGSYGFQFIKKNLFLL